jgi:hypothetical protein
MHYITEILLKVVLNTISLNQALAHACSLTGCHIVHVYIITLTHACSECSLTGCHIVHVYIITLTHACSECSLTGCHIYWLCYWCLLKLLSCWMVYNALTNISLHFHDKNSDLCKFLFIVQEAREYCYICIFIKNIFSVQKVLS